MDGRTRVGAMTLLVVLAGCALGAAAPDRDRQLGASTDADADDGWYGARGRRLLHGPADPQVGIPPGSFVMGCVAGDAACEADEQPAHPVRLPEFRIDRFEVTWSRYAECVDAGVCSKIHNARCYVWDPQLRRFVVGAGIDGELIGAELPVVCASWAQAREYCRFRGGKLPTEAQWERAARADTRTRYPWGNASPGCEHARFHDCVEATRPVGTVPAGASWYGVHDLAGNAWEWVSDWYAGNAYAQPGRRRSPRGPWEGKVRVVRGGSFYDDALDLRASYRYGLSPQYGYSTVGFRCAARVR